MRVLIVGISRAFDSVVFSCLRGFPDVQIVGIARDGREGIRLAQQFLPELVIAQFDMPDMTGPALTRALKSDNIAPPFVVIVSSTDAPYCGKLAHQAGADGHLDRTTLGQLVPLMERLIGQRKIARPGRLRYLAASSGSP